MVAENSNKLKLAKIKNVQYTSTKKNTFTLIVTLQSFGISYLNLQPPFWIWVYWYLSN